LLPYHIENIASITVLTTASVSILLSHTIAKQSYHLLLRVCCKPEFWFCCFVCQWL